LRAIIEYFIKFKKRPFPLSAFITPPGIFEFDKSAPAYNTGYEAMPGFRIRRRILAFDNKKWNFAFTFVLTDRHGS
jgi:hypothetical protein